MLKTTTFFSDDNVHLLISAFPNILKQINVKTSHDKSDSSI